jgi:hypothetical protein
MDWEKKEIVDLTTGDHLSLLNTYINLGNCERAITCNQEWSWTIHCRALVARSLPIMADHSLHHPLDRRHYQDHNYEQHQHFKTVQH